MPTKGQTFKIPNDGREWSIIEMTIVSYGASFKGFVLSPNDEVTFEESRMSFGSDGMPEDIYSIVKNGVKHQGTIFRK